MPLFRDLCLTAEETRHRDQVPQMLLPRRATRISSYIYSEIFGYSIHRETPEECSRKSGRRKKTFFFEFLSGERCHDFNSWEFVSSLEFESAVIEKLAFRQICRALKAREPGKWPSPAKFEPPLGIEKGECDCWQPDKRNKH